MHIAEGVLNVPVLVTGAVIGLTGVAIGLKRLKDENLMFAGMLGAAFFVASLIHVPVGMGSAHLILNGLLGVFLGAAAFPVILISLLLQAVLFQFGGLTVLGVNTATMGLGALSAYYLFHSLSNRIGVGGAGFIAGFSGVFVAGLLTAMALAFSDEGFTSAAVAIFLSNLPVMIAEAFITFFIVRYIQKVRPELLRGFQSRS